MTQTHRKLYDNTSNISPYNILPMGVATDLWLRPIDAVYPSSRPCLYLAVPARFRFSPTSACPRPGGAIDAGSCQARSCSGEDTRVGAALGARSGPIRRRSGVLRANVIVVPPWDSPT